MDRRASLKTASLLALGLSLPNISLPHQDASERLSHGNDVIPDHFPNISLEIVEEVVGKSHFDFDRVRQLVDVRPELSRSVWEWRFGDFESAIGAASHVGRRDIAQYLMRKGARPTIFTFAMFGHFQAIKAIVEGSPGIQSVSGPHGISLLDHALAGERMKDTMTKTERGNLEKTIDYLISLGNASGEKYMEVAPDEQKKYLGDYKYAIGEKDGFSIGINMRKLLSLGPIGGFGGALYKIGENKFTYNGAPSVTITFNFQNNQVKSLTLTEPNTSITAIKIS